MGNTQETIEVKIKALVAGIKEVQKLQSEIKGIEKLAGKKLSVNVTGTDRALKFIRELYPAADGLIDRLQGIEKAAGVSFGNMVVGVGLAGTASLGLGTALYSVLQQLDKLIHDTIEAGSRFHDLSVESGLSVETLSGLQSQARQSNTDLETLSKGVFFLQKNLQSASEGNKELRRTFAELGITDVDAALKDTEGTFRKVLKSLSEITDEGKRNATGAEVMGRGYESLRNFVADLNGEVDEAIDKSRELGLVMSTEAAAAADRLGDEIQRLKDRAEALRLKFGAELLPMMEDFVDTVGAQLNRNAKDFEQWADRVGAAADVLRGVTSIANNIYGALGFGATQAEKDVARGERLAGYAIDSFKAAAKKRTGGDGGGGGGGGKGGGGGGTKRPEIDTLDAQLSLTRAQIESGFALTKDLLERENRLYEDKLEDRLITIKDFYVEQRRIQTQAIDAELIKLGQLMGQEKLRFDAEKEKISKEKGLTKKERKAKEENEINKHLQASLSLQQQIDILNGRRTDIPDEIARKERQVTAELQKQIAAIKNSLREEEGRTFDAELNRIKEQFKDNLLNALANTGGGLTEPILQVIGGLKDIGGVAGKEFGEILDGAGLRFEDMSLEVQAIIKLIDILIGKAKNTELLTNLGAGFAEHQFRLEKILSQRQGNYIQELRVRKQINEENKIAIALLEKEVRELEIRAEQTNNPQLLVAVRQHRLEIERLKQSQEDFNRTLKDVSIDAAVDGLTNMFANIASDASNAKEYVRDFFASFLDEINRVIIRMLVMKAIMAVLGFLGGGGDGFFGNKDSVMALDGQFASGGIQPATPGGRIIQVAEGGFDEVVLTTDPKHRSRTERLLAAFLTRTGIGSSFARGGFASGESILASLTSGIPRLAAGDFISNLPGPDYAGAMSGGSTTNNFNFKERPNGQSRIPSRAAFRDAARMLRGTK